MADTWKDKKDKTPGIRRKRGGYNECREEYDRCDACKTTVLADSLVLKNGKWVCGFCAH